MSRPYWGSASGAMALRETLQQILTTYRDAVAAPLEGHPLAQFIRGEAEETVAAALGELGTGLVVEGSAGQGNWATVPWISVFDPAITTSATRGYYVVYLFHAHDPVVHLSLNQGTTAVREEFHAACPRDPERSRRFDAKAGRGFCRQTPSPRH